MYHHHYPIQTTAQVRNGSSSWLMLLLVLVVVVSSHLIEVVQSFDYDNDMDHPMLDPLATIGPIECSTPVPQAIIDTSMVDYPIGSNLACPSAINYIAAAVGHVLNSYSYQQGLIEDDTALNGLLPYPDTVNTTISLIEDQNIQVLYDDDFLDITNITSWFNVDDWYDDDEITISSPSSPTDDDYFLDDDTSLLRKRNRQLRTSTTTTTTTTTALAKTKMEQQQHRQLQRCNPGCPNQHVSEYCAKFWCGLSIYNRRDLQQVSTSTSSTGSSTTSSSSSSGNSNVQVTNTTTVTYVTLAHLAELRMRDIANTMNVTTEDPACYYFLQHATCIDVPMTIDDYF